MKYSAALSLAAIAVGVNGQGAAPGLKPSGAAPAGCVSSGTGSYEVTIVKPAVAAKRDVIEKRVTTCGTDALVVQLNNGVLTDGKGRIGSIVANRQFQFDGPPAQTGAIFDAGFSFCPNTSIAIGPTTDFFQCLSGSFFNLYDQPSESNCSLVNLNVQPCTLGTSTGSGSSVPASSAGAVTQTSDGQPQATTPATVSQQSDGQPTASSAPVVTQISDGQPQGTNATVPAPTTPPVATGGASSIYATGAFAVIGAVAAFFL